MKTIEQIEDKIDELLEKILDAKDSIELYEARARINWINKTKWKELAQEHKNNLKVFESNLKMLRWVLDKE